MAPKPKKDAVLQPTVLVQKPYEPRTPISPEEREALYDQLQAFWEDLAAQYGYEGEKPDHVHLRLQSVLGAVDREQALERFRVAKERAQVSILAAWARGRCPGPSSSRAIEKRIKKAESLARMLEAKGLDDQAASQRERVEKLREELEATQSPPVGS